MRQQKEEEEEEEEKKNPIRFAFILDSPLY